jgi:hypothetical protein
VRNIEASAAVRMRHRGRWRDATATVDELTAEDLRRFNAYARLGRGLAAIDPMLVRVGYLAGSERA